MITLAGVYGTIGILLNIIWPLRPTRTQMLLLQAASNVMFILHYWQINARTGALMSLVSVVQAMLAIPLEKKPGFKYIYLLSVPVIAILMLNSWAGIPSAFVAFAMIMVSIGRYQVDSNRFRTILLFSYFGWSPHNFLVKSWAGLACDALTLCTCFYMIHRERQQLKQLNLN